MLTARLLVVPSQTVADVPARLFGTFVEHMGRSVAIIRVPGIYAADRLPLKRLAERAPALCAQDDVYTNHIHADDLARIVALALFRARPGRVYHAVDDTHMKMADYFDVVADAFGAARVPRLARAALAAQASPPRCRFR